MFRLKAMTTRIQTQNWHLDRRSFLRGLGVSLALPMLDAMAPSILRAAKAPGKPARRLVCIGNPFGMYPDGFFPKTTGPDFALTPLLAPLEPHRGRFTVFSNLDHGLNGGHNTVHTFLSGIKSGDAKGFPERNVTLDQRAAEAVGPNTRFPVLNTGVGGECEMSWTRNGVKVPPITSSRQLFRTLFIDESAAARQQVEQSNRLHGSILDVVQDQARSLERRLGARDREKLDEYFTSVRDVEVQLGMSNQWLNQPKPKVEMAEPQDAEFVESLPVFFDLILLALTTDSTRVATLEVPHSFNTSDLGLTKGYHALSHHGKDASSVVGLMVIEKFFIAELARFIERLHATSDAPTGSTLLDSTTVLFGSGMGNGSIHSNKNLPLIVAGGGFRHAGHVSMPTDPRKRVPLCNLYVSILQRLGVETERFNLGTGTLSGFA